MLVTLLLLIPRKRDEAIYKGKPWNVEANNPDLVLLPLYVLKPVDVVLP
jgi:hypothetical protein